MEKKAKMMVIKIVWVLCLCSSIIWRESMGASKPINLLFVIVDDLRPALGCYGDSRAHTPHLDQLAKRSVLFERAYAQQALCAPSRNSLLTSRRPSSLRLYDTNSYWRNVVGDFTTIPQHFKNHGYRTASFGKVFHPGKSCNHSDDSPYSWTEPAFHPYTERYKDAPVCSSSSSELANNLVCPVSVASMPNATLPDIEILQAARKFLRTAVVPGKQPFFLAVGFQKPHIPLKYPKQYLEYHPLHKYQVPDNYHWPRNLSHLAYNPWMDLRQRDDVKKLSLTCPWQKIPTTYARKIIQSYYAAVTYIDELVGELLHELDWLNLRDNTIVLLTSDHGWSLGEHAEWAKYSNFEVALRVPLLLSAPGLHTAKIREPVELLDLFPTLAELAGLPVPPACPRSSPDRLCTEGSSLLTLLNPLNESTWKGTAISLYPRSSLEPVCVHRGDQPRLHNISFMGYSVRTIDYRYTAWLPFSRRDNQPDWQKILAEELYDHNDDPDENHNVADSASYHERKTRLRRILIDSLCKSQHY